MISMIYQLPFSSNKTSVIGRLTVSISTAGVLTAFTRSDKSELCRICGKEKLQFESHTVPVHRLIGNCAKGYIDEASMTDTYIMHLAAAQVLIEERWGKDLDSVRLSSLEK